MKLRSFTQQTFFYGLSSILPRFLLFVLNPLFSYNFLQTDLGVISILYSSVIFIQILLTFGFETGFFYYAQFKDNNKLKIYGTAFNTILFFVLLFIILGFFNVRNISSFLKLETHYRYIYYFLLIVSFDILCTMPYAWLRYNNMASRFVFIKMAGVSINFVLCILLIWFIPKYCVTNGTFLFHLSYTKSIELIFIANLMGSAVVFLLLLKEIRPVLFVFDYRLVKKLLMYSFPVVLAGLLTTVNDIIDRFFILYLLPVNFNPSAELGLYSANIKLAVLMAIYVQVFRLTVEPYFFREKQTNGFSSIHNVLFKYFALYGLVLFLCVVLFLDIFKYFVGPPEYWVGLSTIPVYLLANFFLGLYFNLSFWYKLSGKTWVGIIIALGGLVVSVLMNIFLVPRFSYFGCAWSHLASYFVMFLFTWILSQYYSPIRFDIYPVFIYLALALGIFGLSYFLQLHNYFLNLGKNAFILILFLIYLERKENFFSILYRKVNQSVD